MGMRLLSKQELTAKKAQDHRAEVAEGLKLARKIDGLRETLAEEEASLTLFRNRTTAEIHAEIAMLASQRDALLSEAVSLRKEIAKGMIEIDARKAQLILEAEELGRQADIIDSRTVALKKLADLVHKQEKEVVKEHRRVQNLMDVVRETLRDASADRNQAANVLKTVQLQMERVEKIASEVEADLISRDMSVAARERAITIKEERLKLSEEAFQVRLLKLNDREKTLEREFKRLNKQ